LELYRQGGRCPILVTGGAPADYPELGCAEVMRNFLIDLGVTSSDVLLESQARTTYENALESGKILQERRLHKIIVVTSALHLGRAVACFRKQGSEALPCACQFRATPTDSSRYGFLPSAAALQDSQRVFHEWLGLAWYWLKGRI